MNGNQDNFGLDSIQPLEPVVPTPTVEDNNVATEVPETFVTQPEPVSYEEPTVATTSFTEIPVAGVTEQQPEFGVVNEHPDAKISLHKEEEVSTPVASNLPEEKMDKSTMWMLIWLFVGMLAVIIALPYIFNLF